MCADALKDGHLVRVLPDTPPTEDTIYAVWPGNAQLSRKARTLVDLLVARLPAALPQ
jgi:DNA-binding transcriptional LysR family regulator